MSFIIQKLNEGRQAVADPLDENQHRPSKRLMPGRNPWPQISLFQLPLPRASLQSSPPPPFLILSRFGRSINFPTHLYHRLHRHH